MVQQQLYPHELPIKISHQVHWLDSGVLLTSSDFQPKLGLHPQKQPYMGLSWLTFGPHLPRTQPSLLFRIRPLAHSIFLSLFFIFLYPKNRKVWELKVKKPKLCDYMCSWVCVHVCLSLASISRGCSSIVNTWSFCVALSDRRAGNVRSLLS